MRCDTRLSYSQPFGTMRGLNGCLRYLPCDDTLADLAELLGNRHCCVMFHLGNLALHLLLLRFELCAKLGAESGSALGCCLAQGSELLLGNSQRTECLLLRDSCMLGSCSFVMASISAFSTF